MGAAGKGEGSLSRPPQMLGVVVGYLLVMRLNVAVSRWDFGMSATLGGRERNVLRASLGAGSGGFVS